MEAISRSHGLPPHTQLDGVLIIHRQVTYVSTSRTRWGLYVSVVRLDIRQVELTSSSRCLLGIDPPKEIHFQQSRTPLVNISMLLLMAPWSWQLVQEQIT